MQLIQNKSLRTKNTFGIDCFAEHYVEINTISELEEAARLPYRKRVLGGGSNILLPGFVQGLTMSNCLAGTSVIAEDSEFVWIKSASGETWHKLVMYTVAHGWGGLENLALIPGTVGAAPIQNIGAYGAEVADVITNVNWYHLHDFVHITTPSTDCHFGYRESIFKRNLSDMAFITDVTFKLSKKPQVNTAYGAISEELKKMNVTATVESVANAVINIRRSKLPDPTQVGNAGSFFKNPTISKSQLLLIQNSYPSIPFYNLGEDMVKIPAGWLIEQCGWKGYTAPTGAGVHDKQALVLVNKHNATGNDIWQLSELILKSVIDKFSIQLEREVQVW
jgi:UDP-N-acetylmuramate dehydrogenase